MGVEISILKKVVAQCPPTVSGAPSKVCVPEPKGFGGARNAKELENFLWDMEQFFKVAHVPDDEMVSITSMYLSGDAKLWWCTWMGDDAESWKAPDYYLGDSEEGTKRTIPTYEFSLAWKRILEATEAHGFGKGIC